MTRRELLGAFGIAFVAGPARRIAAGSQDKKNPKTATVTLAIAGMT